MQEDILEEDQRKSRGGWHGAVLLSDEIEYYSTKVVPPLIDPFHQEHLRAARYNLTLGSHARLGGVDVVIAENAPLKIAPYQMAIVSTYEKLNLPRFLIARWALKVSSVYEGLLWVGALQVDPGWSGELFAPVYNLADREVVLDYRKELFAMDFVKTTPFRKGISIPMKQGRDSLGDFDLHRLRSFPREMVENVERVTRQSDELGARVTRQSDELRAQSITFITIVVAVLAAVIAALAVVAIAPVIKPEGDILGGWPMTALAVSFFSLVLSLAALSIAVWGRRGRS